MNRWLDGGGGCCHSYPACGFASSFSLVAQNHSTLDPSGFHDLRGLGGHLAVPEAPRGFTVAAKCLDAVGKWPFCGRGQLLEAREKTKTSCVLQVSAAVANRESPNIWYVQ